MQRLASNPEALLSCFSWVFVKGVKSTTRISIHGMCCRVTVSTFCIGRVPDECPASMDELWKSCIAIDPAKRPTADVIMARIQEAVEESLKGL